MKSIYKFCLVFVFASMFLCFAVFSAQAAMYDIQNTWTANGDGQVGSRFTEDAMTSGDVNGDGYDDVIIGAYYYDTANNNAGKVYAYMGSADGLSTVVSWTTSGDDEANVDFGSSISSGDVNGDGYDDVVVGASRYSSDRGKAYLYLGSASGLATTSSWTSLGDNIANSNFGNSVDISGDVNNDSYNDAIIGAWYHDTLNANAGKAYLYLGTSSGLASGSVGSESWSSSGDDEAGALYGSSLSFAGDVNGDGYDDVVVGARNYGTAPFRSGKVYLYSGTSLGLSSGAVGGETWSSVGDNQANTNFGDSVSLAGDTNGDGYSDIIVGARGYDIVDNEGKVYVYLGSASGLSATASWTSSGDNEASDLFGNSVVGGLDVNGDGYDDVVVGAYFHDTNASNEGKAYLYLGSASGLSSGAPGQEIWSSSGDDVALAYFGGTVAAAGDVNGNGYSDFLVGAYRQDDYTGKAFLYSNEADFSVSINSGVASTYSENVTLTLSSYNDPTEMIISENEDFSGASWETFAISKAFTLSSGDGEKTVYAKFRDSSYESQRVSALIDLNTVLGNNEKIVLGPGSDGGKLKGQGLILIFKKLPNKLTKNSKYWMRWKKYNKYPKKWKKKKKTAIKRYWRLKTNLRKYKTKGKKKNKYKIQVTFKYSKKLWKKLRKNTDKKIWKKQLRLKYKTKKGKQWKVIKKHWKKAKVQNKKKKRRFVVRYFKKFKKKTYFFTIGRK